MKQDRFLLGILIGIGVLAALAVALFFIRKGDQSYGSEDTPEGVARNYILALQNQDFERAYQYLAEGEDRPDLTTFQSNLLASGVEIERVAVELGSAKVSGDRAVVGITVVHPGNGLFGDVWREVQSAVMLRTPEGEWKIASMPYPFWFYSWYNPEVKP